MNDMSLFKRVDILEATLADVLAADHLRHDREILTATWNVRPKMADILDVMHRATGISIAEIKGPDRHRCISWPRQDAMRLMHWAGYSTPQIGDFLGGRDHSTVLEGIAKSIKRLRGNST